MTFPTIPTSGAGRILATLNTAGGATKTFPNLSSLTKNAGDLLIAIAVEYDGNSTNAEFSSWGASFNEFVDQASTTNMAIGAAYKFSDGTETGTFTVTTADTSANDSVMILMSIAGAHDTTPPEGGTISVNTTAASDAGSLNPAGWGTEDTLWIWVGAGGEVSGTGVYTGVEAVPTNYNNSPFDSGITADAAGGVNVRLGFRQLNAASEDPGAGTYDLTNARNSALLIAVRTSGHGTAAPAAISTPFTLPAVTATGGGGGAVPTVEGTPTTFATGHAISKPGSTAVGEKLVIAWLTTAVGATPATPVISGFTQRATFFADQVADMRITILDRTVDGGEGSTFTDTSGDGNFAEGVCVRVAGAGAFSTSTGEANNAGVSTASLESFTTASANCLAFGAYFCWSSAQTHSTPPSNWTQVVNYDTGQYLYERDVASASTPGDEAITLSGSETAWVSLTFSYESSGGAVDDTATPAAISRSWTLPAASPSGAGNISPVPISRSWTLPAPSPTGAGNIVPAAITRAWTLPAASPSGEGNTAPAPIASALTLPAVTTSGEGNATPAPISSTLALPAVTLEAGTTMTPAPISSALALPAVTAEGGTTAAPAPISSALALPAVTTDAGASGTPAAISRAWILPATSPSQDGTTTPAAISRAWTLPAPGSSGEGNTAPAAISRAWTLPAPTTSGEGNAAPAAISAPSTLPAPSASGASAGTATPAAVSAPATLPAATATGESAGIATPAPIPSALALPAPTATGEGSTAPAPISRAWTLPAAAASGTSSGTAVPDPITRAWTLPTAAASGEASGTATPTPITTPFLLPFAGASGGAPTLVGTATTFVSAHSVAKPVGTTVGEKLVLVWMTSAVDATPVIPVVSGFTQRATFFANQVVDIRITVLDREVDGGEGSTFTDTSGDVGFASGACFRVSGAGFFSASTGEAMGAGGATASFESFTAYADNSLGLAAYFCWSSVQTHTAPPAGWNEFLVFDTGQYVYQQTIASATTIADAAITLSGTETAFASLTFSYEPAGGAPSGIAQPAAIAQTWALPAASASGEIIEVAQPAAISVPFALPFAMSGGAPTIVGTPITFVASHIVPKPAGTTVGEKLVIVFATTNAPGGSPIVPIFPGFTQRATFWPDQVVDMRITIFDRVVDGTEGSVFTDTSGDVDFCEGVCFRVAGAGDFSVSTGEGNGEVVTTARLESFATALNNSLALGAYFSWSGSVTHTGPPAGWTEVVNYDTAQYLYSRTIPNATLVPDTSITLSASETVFVSLTFSYQPLGGVADGIISPDSIFVDVIFPTANLDALIAPTAISSPFTLPAAESTGILAAAPAAIRAWTLPAVTTRYGVTRTVSAITVSFLLPDPHLPGEAQYVNITFTALSPVFARTAEVVAEFAARAAGDPELMTRTAGAPALAHDAGAPEFVNRAAGDPETVDRTASTEFLPRTAGPPTK